MMCRKVERPCAVTICQTSWSPRSPLVRARGEATESYATAGTVSAMRASNVVVDSWLYGCPCLYDAATLELSGGR